MLKDIDSFQVDLIKRASKMLVSNKKSEIVHAQAQSVLDLKSIVQVCSAPVCFLFVMQIYMQKCVGNFVCSSNFKGTFVLIAVHVRKETSYKFCFNFTWICT